jgi:hypothetical protein
MSSPTGPKLTEAWRLRIRRPLVYAGRHRAADDGVPRLKYDTEGYRPRHADGEYR